MMVLINSRNLPVLFDENNVVMASAATPINKESRSARQLKQ
jgi:hypothetical protein